ncbi:MAG: iron-containing alcohol dehydrogenase [Desulfohalobiaceae bacterium]|nr:iron-containing alcohol dehydrogenase [Desulfohalobiaceae bacterium]
MINFQQDTASSCLVPRQIVFGDGASRTIADHLKNWSVSTGQVLVVSDAEISKMGFLDPVMDALQKGGFSCSFFDEIAGEPDLFIANELVNRVRRDPFTAVVGVGGGSAMDMAKLAAAFAGNPGQVEENLGPAKFEHQPLPLALVPTTAGTGSEATAISMLSVDDKKSIVLSPHLVPLIAVLDPLLTRSLPPKVTAATGLDALSHALEAYMSTRANPYTDLHVYRTCQIIAAFLKKAYEDGTDLEARRAMLFAAHSGGICLNAGVVLGHSVAYTISNRTHYPHGTCCAMSLPYVLAYNSSACLERLKALAFEIIGLEDASPKNLVTWVSSLATDLGIPGSLQEIGLSLNDLGEMVDECLNRYPRPNNPVALEEKRLTKMYKAFFEGDPLGYYDRIEQE